MLRFMIYIVFLNHLLMVNSTFLDDLEPLFVTKQCIEASLVSVSLDQGESRMLDSSIVIDETNVLNNTVSFAKSVTSKIHELSQYNNIEFIYKLVSEDGPAHAKTYKVSLTLGDELYQGAGPSLKKAKQEAAALALENTFYEHPPQKLNVADEKNLTPTVMLNNIAMKLGLDVSYHLLNGKEEQTIDSYGAYDEPYGELKNDVKIRVNSTSINPLRVTMEESQISGPFTVRVKIGPLLFKGIGHTIQGARHDAALNALKTMEHTHLFKDGVCSSEESAQECKQKKENLKSPITRIHEFAQRQNLPLEFNIISETGKSHKKVFIMQCKLGELETEGEGTSKKESKRIAAEKMLKILPLLPEKYSENAIVNSFSTKKKKKKKTKVVLKDTVDNFIHSVSNIASSIWENIDTDGSVTEKYGAPKKMQKSVPKKVSPKEKILELGSKLNIHIDFTDLSKHGDHFFSLMNMGVKPPHLCLGKAVTRESSHDVAALHGMKFLQKSRIFEKSEFIQYDLSADIESYELEETETGYKSVEDIRNET